MKTRTNIVLLIVSAFGFAACGGSGEAAGLKHRVSDKELRGLTGEGVMRIETAKSEVTRLEVVKFEELVKMTGVVVPKETQRKINLDQQALDEQKKLIDLQTKLLKAEQNTQAERTKLEAEKQKGTPN